MSKLYIMVSLNNFINDLEAWVDITLIILQIAINVEMVGETEVRPNINGSMEIRNMDGKVSTLQVQFGKIQWSTSIQEKLTQKTDIHWEDKTSKACQKQLNGCYNPQNR